MQQRGERTSVNHELGGLVVDGAAHIQIETIADLNRHSLQSTPVEAGTMARDIRVDFQNEQLPLTIQYRFGRKENIGSDKSIDLLLVQKFRGANRVCKINNHDWLIDQSERAEAQFSRDHHIIKCAIDLNALRQIRFGRNWCKAKIIATMQGDGAHRRSAIDAEPRWPTVDVSAYEQMILSRTYQRQRFKLRSCSCRIRLVCRG